MIIVYFEYEIAYGSGIIKDMVPGDFQVLIENSKHLISAEDLSIGAKAWDRYGVYIGVCIKIVDNDSNSDLFFTDGRGLKAIIVELREKIKKLEEK